MAADTILMASENYEEARFLYKHTNKSREVLSHCGAGSEYWLSMTLSKVVTALH